MATTNDVRVEVYRTFIQQGRAPVPLELAGALGITVEETQSALRQLHADDVIALMPETNLIWLAHPFCADDGPFEVRSDGRSWDAICIWDALGILVVLESDGDVTTSCPDCGESLSLGVRGGQLQVEDELVVHYGVPAARWYEDVGYT